MNQLARFWKPALGVLTASLLPTVSGACQPSKACALERAQQLAIAHVIAEPDGFHDMGGWKDMARLVAMLERKARGGDTAPRIAHLLAEARARDRRDQVLRETAWELADVMPERALQLTMSIEDLKHREDALHSLLIKFTPDGPFDYAVRVVASMPPGADRISAAMEVAHAQLQAGLIEPARSLLKQLAVDANAELEDQDTAELHIGVRNLLAHAAALEGDDALAFKIADGIDPNDRSFTLLNVNRVQIERQARAAALQGIELRLNLARDPGNLAIAKELIEDLAAVGEADRASALIFELQVEEPVGIEAIAYGQIRAGNFAGAHATFERLGLAERRLSYVPAALAEALLLSGAEVASVLDKLGSPNHLQHITKGRRKNNFYEFVATMPSGWF